MPELTPFQLETSAMVRRLAAARRISIEEEWIEGEDQVYGVLRLATPRAEVPVYVYEDEAGFSLGPEWKIWERQDFSDQAGLQDAFVAGLDEALAGMCGRTHDGVGVGNDRAALHSPKEVKPLRYFPAVTLLLALVVAVALQWHLRTHNELRAKKTATQMLILAPTLEADRLRISDLDSLRTVVEEHGRSEYLVDGWGHELVIERRRSSDPFVIISLGRDGSRGDCCRPRTGKDWEADAVLEGDQWLQVWSIK